MKTVRKKVHALIFARKGKETYFLILHRVLHWRGWELVKETIERGETPRQAVIRGIKEETKLKNWKIVRRVNRRIRFSVKGKKMVIVGIYIVKADMKEKVDVNQKIREHDMYKWVKEREAVQLLTFESAKRLVREFKE